MDGFVVPDDESESRVRGVNRGMIVMVMRGMMIMVMRRMTIVKTGMMMVKTRMAVTVMRVVLTTIAMVKRGISWRTTDLISKSTRTTRMHLRMKMSMWEHQKSLQKAPK